MSPISTFSQATALTRLRSRASRTRTFRSGPTLRFRSTATASLDRHTHPRGLASVRIRHAIAAAHWIDDGRAVVGSHTTPTALAVRALAVLTLTTRVVRGARARGDTGPARRHADARARSLARVAVLAPIAATDDGLDIGTRARYRTTRARTAAGFAVTAELAARAVAVRDAEEATDVTGEVGVGPAERGVGSRSRVVAEEDAARAEAEVRAHPVAPERSARALEDASE